LPSVKKTSRMMARDHGKPLHEARGEVGGIPEILDWFGEEGPRVYGRTIPSQDQVTTQTALKTPVGPVIVFSPWNFPMGEIAAHLAPALAAECTAVVKAPEDAPSSGQELIRAFHDAGVPAGVINFVTGRFSEIAEVLIDHPMMRKFRSPDPKVLTTWLLPGPLFSMVGSQFRNTKLQHDPQVLPTPGRHCQP